SSDLFTVVGNELMVEEKGVHSVEKFIIARRLMYWQVYLHKTVLGTEMLLVNILKRAKELAAKGKDLFATPALGHFLYHRITLDDFKTDPKHLALYASLDDTDIFTSVKIWQEADDRILSALCKMLVQRKLYKTLLSTQHLDVLKEEKDAEFKKSYPDLSSEERAYFVFTGKTETSTYDTDDERIKIAMKNGTVKDISEVDNALVTQALARPVHKNYICFALPAYNIL